MLLQFQDFDVILSSERHGQGVARRGRDDDRRRHPEPSQEVSSRRQSAQVCALCSTRLRFRESARVGGHADRLLDEEHPQPSPDEATQ